MPAITGRAHRGNDRGTPSEVVERALLGIVIAGGAAFFAVLARSLPDILDEVNHNSDVVTPMVVAQQWSSTPHGTINLLHHGSYLNLAIDLASRSLPAHRDVWMASPVALSVVALAVLAWGVHRLAGAWAAAVTSVVTLATAPDVLFPLVTQAVHGTTHVGVVLMAAVVVLITTARSKAAAAVAIAVVCVYTGVDLASDFDMTMLSTLVPFIAAVFTAAVAGRLGRRRVRWPLLAAGAGVVATTGTTAIVARAVAHRLGLHIVAVPVHVADPAQLARNGNLVGRLLLAMNNALFFQEPITALTPVVVAAAVVVGVAALLPVAVLGREVLRLIVGAGRSAARPRDGLPVPLVAWFVYWGVCETLVLAGVVGTDVAVDGGAMRYLIPVFYAMTAVVPVLAARRRRYRVTAAAGVALSVALAAHVMLVSMPGRFTGPEQERSVAVAHVLASHGLQRGYAPYWVANAVTWETSGQVQSLAVLQGAQCGSADQATVCPFPANAAEAWYLPQPERTTYLVVLADGTGAITPPSASLGRPSALYRSGEVAVFVYPYDLALSWTH